MGRRIAEIVELKKAGWNNVQIGQELGMSRDAVRRALQKVPVTPDDLEVSVGVKALNALRSTPAAVTQPGIDHDVRWGHGPAQLVAPATTETTEVVVFLSDVHYPYQDEAAVKAALKLVRAVKPHRVVLNGDINDFFQLSRFNRDGSRERELQQEIDQGNEFREAVRASAPDAVIDEVEGNHDNRVKSYVAVNARALQSLRALQPESLFRYKDLEINWHPGAGFRLRPEFLVKHGTLVRKGAGATAKAEFLAAGISGISGHTHRLSTWRQGGYVPRQWTEQGCLCRVDPDYVVGRPDWSQGCAVGEFSTLSGGGFMVYEVPFVDGQLRFGPKAF